MFSISGLQVFFAENTHCLQSELKGKGEWLWSDKATGFTAWRRIQNPAGAMGALAIASCPGALPIWRQSVRASNRQDSYGKSTPTTEFLEARLPERHLPSLNAKPLCSLDLIRWDANNHSVGMPSQTFSGQTKPEDSLGEVWYRGGPNRIMLVVLVFLVALTANLWSVTSPPVTARYGLGPFGDSYLYHKLAYNLLEGHGFSGTDDGRSLGWQHRDQPLKYEPSVTRGPIYPAFLSGIYGIFGNRDAMASITTWHINWNRVRIAQAILNATTALLVFWMVRLIWVGCFWPALTGAIIYAFCFYTQYYARALLSESVTTFILTCFITVCIKALRTGTVWLWLAAGLFSGFTVLSRPEYILFPLVFGGFMLSIERGHRLSGMRNVALFIGGCIVAIGPWSLRNLLVFHRPIPVCASSVGLALYEGTFESPKTWKGWGIYADDVFGSPAEKERFSLLTASYDKKFAAGSDDIRVEDEQFTQMALKRIRSHPLACVTNWIEKMPRLWYQQYIPMYPDREASGVWFLLYSAFALAGLALGARHERTLMAPVVLLFVYLNLIFFPLHIEPRYGVALMPGIIALAAFGLGKLSIWTTEKTRRLQRPFEQVALHD